MRLRYDQEDHCGVLKGASVQVSLLCSIAALSAARYWKGSTKTMARESSKDDERIVCMSFARIFKGMLTHQSDMLCQSLVFIGVEDFKATHVAMPFM